MHITGTQFSYYQICKRKLWLASRDICMEQESDLVYQGKTIHEGSYPQRTERFEEVAIDGIKVDFYDANRKVIHEIKKSKKMEKAHEWQLKYYMCVFKRHGIEVDHGILEYPTLRKTKQVELSEEDCKEIASMERDIEGIVASDACPPVLRKARCKACSYYDFCYSGEDEYNV